jgi:hypothetical protein
MEDKDRFTICAPFLVEFSHCLRDAMEMAQIVGEAFSCSVDIFKNNELFKTVKNDQG